MTCTDWVYQCSAIYIRQKWCRFWYYWRLSVNTFTNCCKIYCMEQVQLASGIRGHVVCFLLWTLLVGGSVMKGLRFRFPAFPWDFPLVGNYSMDRLKSLFFCMNPLPVHSVTIVPSMFLQMKYLLFLRWNSRLDLYLNPVIIFFSRSLCLGLSGWFRSRKVCTESKRSRVQVPFKQTFFSWNCKI